MPHELPNINFLKNTWLQTKNKRELMSNLKFKKPFALYSIDVNDAYIIEAKSC